jgi:adenylylsulfate kinase
MIYWFTGQPGSGKTTLAKKLAHIYGNRCVHIDGDTLRRETQNFDYSENGRKLNMRRAIDITKKYYKKGYVVIVSLVSPYKDVRNQLKRECKTVEIYLYTTVKRGKEKYFVSDYQEPVEDFISIDTTNISVSHSIEKILKYKKKEE